MNSLTDIGANTRILASMNEGRVNRMRGGRDYEDFKRKSLLSAAQIIQQS
jgi:epoxyqueuosine reductase QueG